MTIKLIDDKARIEDFLLKTRGVYCYHLGDLDDFFWPHTEWTALEDRGEIKALNLIYCGPGLPVLLAVENGNLPEMRVLLAGMLPALPERFYAHLSPGLQDVLAAACSLQDHGEHYKMLLTSPHQLANGEPNQARRVQADDLPELQALYAAGYPGNWFDPRMIETGQYFGIWQGGRLVSAAGVHVYSAAYRIAALGNITTHPGHRRQGLGRQVTAALCRSLLHTVDLVGLNVKADNTAAIYTYQKLGFTILASYHEYTGNKL